MGSKKFKIHIYDVELWLKIDWELDDMIKDSKKRIERTMRRKGKR